MPFLGIFTMFLVQALLYLQETHHRMATFNLTNYLADPVGLIQCFFPWKSWSQEPVVLQKSRFSCIPIKKNISPPQKLTNVRDIPFWFRTWIIWSNQIIFQRWFVEFRPPPFRPPPGCHENDNDQRRPWISWPPPAWTSNGMPRKGLTPSGGPRRNGIDK